MTALRPLLALLVLTPALALAQATLPAKKVVFTSSARLGEAEFRELRAAAPNLQIVVPPRDRLLAELADADAIVGPLSREHLRAAPRVKWVQVTSAGVENVLAYPELRERDIVLTNMKIVQGPEIADHAFALLLALTRRLDIALEAQRTQTWHPLSQYGPPLELHGKTAVIVGVGGIGQQIAIRAKAFGMTVIGVDPKDIPYAPFLDRTVWPDRLDEVLPSADVVFVSAPHTPQTERMFRAEQFARMKRGALFIAVSRGRLFDNDALAAALQQGHLGGAGLDVTNPEPLPKQHPLWTLPRVIITPHIAGRSDGEGARYFEIYRENLVRFARGEPLRHVVDKEKGY